MAEEKIYDIVILGGGESGTAAAMLAKRQGFNPVVSDNNGIAEIRRQELNQAGIPYEEGRHSEEFFLKAKTIVKSPGIPGDTLLLKLAREKDKEIIGEVEFANRYFNGLIIGITGSNGKTTTTHLTQHLLEKGGKDAKAGGNTGVSFSRMLLDGEPAIAVLELSSFQLEDLVSFRPHYAAFINFSDDHLERYGSSEKYFAAKWRISELQEDDGHFIYDYDDQRIREKVEKQNFKKHLYPFSINHKLPIGGFLENEEMNILINPHNNFTMATEELNLKGQHNQKNTMAAAIMARLFEVSKEDIRESLRSFSGLEHRLEKVISVRGVEFINDSKATNVNAVWYALESMNKPVVWIAGGQDKGNDYAPLFPLAEQKVKALVAVGPHNTPLLNAFEDKIGTIEETATMEEAVQKAYELASKEDVVLLSPACASFDLFENYMKRGEAFKKCVKAL